MFLVEALVLSFIRQLAVGQEVADFQKVRVFGQLIDWVAAIKQHALIAVDVGDLAFARGRRGEAWVEGEHTGLRVEFADIDDVRPDASAIHRQLKLLVVHGDRGRRLLGDFALHRRASSNLIRDPRQRFFATQ